MKYVGTFNDLYKKGFHTNVFDEYFYKVNRKDEYTYGAVFIDIKTREMSFEGNDIKLGQEIIDEIEAADIV